MISIFPDKSLKEKLETFGLGDIRKKREIILNWQKAIKDGSVLRTKEEALQADFLNNFFTDSEIDLLYAQRQAHEINIEKEFYNKFKQLRQDLFTHLKQENKKINKNTLLEKAQKILDRFIFIFFCEDLIPPLLPSDTTNNLIKQYKNERYNINNDFLWTRLKNLFESIDQGNPRADINKFNGGLFAQDTLLDSLVIKDEILYQIILLGSKYDFVSDLNVNILGHIFEQSISDIEELKAQISTPIDHLKEETGTKQKIGKRKKDGIFYTPAYITKYIIEQTVGKWLEDKKQELNFNELPELDYSLLDPEAEIKDLTKTQKTQLLKAQKEHLEFWLAYKENLSNIKILDPACGSGAFLNQAFDYLYIEHLKIDEIIASLKGGQRGIIENLNKLILQNNLFGVDLNEESVEITKLSLWLKTANKSSELTSLDNNIKCGNSLIDDSTVAGKKAFNWNKQFREVFARGGFDIIIGNPPYVQFSEYKDYYSKNYKVFECRDLYTLFIEKSVKLLKNNGSLGFIIPSLFIKNVQYFSLREFLMNNVQINEIKEMGDKVFDNVKMPTAIITLKNKITVGQNWDDFLQNSNVIKNIEKQTFKIQDLTEIMRGLEIGKDKLSSKSDYKILAGEDIKRYGVLNISYISEEIYNEFKKNRDFFSGERLYIRETGERINCIYLEDDNILCTRSLYSIKAKNKDLNLKYLLAIINSQVVQNYYSAKYKANTNIFPKIRIIQVKQIPIPNIPLSQQKPFIEKADLMLEKNKELQNLKQRFLAELKLEKLTKKLENFEELSFDEFIAEYTKTKKIKFKDKLDERNFKNNWLALFENDKKEVLQIKEIINQTDEAIDLMVYELYGLTTEEREIVKGKI